MTTPGVLCANPPELEDSIFCKIKRKFLDSVFDFEGREEAKENWFTVCFKISKVCSKIYLIPRNPSGKKDWLRKL